MACKKNNTGNRMGEERGSGVAEDKIFSKACPTHLLLSISIFLCARGFLCAVCGFCRQSKATPAREKHPLELTRSRSCLMPASVCFCHNRRLGRVSLCILLSPYSFSFYRPSPAKEGKALGTRLFTEGGKGQGVLISFHAQILTTDTRKKEKKNW